MATKKSLASQAGRSSAKPVGKKEKKDAAEKRTRVLVGKVPRIRLFAGIRDRLRVVQSWGPAKGMVAADGRPFLPAPGTPDFLEVLDLEAVHAALS